MSFKSAVFFDSMAFNKILIMHWVVGRVVCFFYKLSYCSVSIIRCWTMDRHDRKKEKPSEDIFQQ